MSGKNAKPAKVYVAMIRTGEKESQPAYFFTKKELDDAAREMELKNIEFCVLVGKDKKSKERK